ncbi:MAG: hypothetical protein ABJL86_02995 [Gilvibacter sp.]
MIFFRLNDYVFYRVYMFYQDGKSYTAGFVAVVQFFSLLSIASLLKYAIEFNIEKYVLIATGILLLALNAYRYENNFDVKALHERWKDESSIKKRLKGWVIFLYTLFVVLFPLIVASD